jgi:hypothetical protein
MPCSPSTPDPLGFDVLGANVRGWYPETRALAHV